MVICPRCIYILRITISSGGSKTHQRLNSEAWLQNYHSAYFWLWSLCMWFGVCTQELVGGELNWEQPGQNTQLLQFKTRPYISSNKPQFYNIVKYMSNWTWATPNWSLREELKCLWSGLNQIWSKFFSLFPVLVPHYIEHRTIGLGRISLIIESSNFCFIHLYNCPLVNLSVLNSFSNVRICLLFWVFLLVYYTA